MGGVGDRLDVADVAGGVAHRLAEHRPGLAIDQLGDGCGAVVAGEAHLHALAGQHVGEQGVGRPV